MYNEYPVDFEYEGKNVQHTYSLYSVSRLFLFFFFPKKAGSPRYMAPEVALGKPYNEKCDVYSFAILLWEMITLREPFQLFGMKAFQTRVWQEDGEQKRPYIPDGSNNNKYERANAHSWTVPMKLLLKRSWCADIPTRNCMSQVSGILRKECVTARGGDETGLEHRRRRSTFVFSPSPVAASPNNKKDGSRRMGGLMQRMTSSKTTKFPSSSAPAIRMQATTASDSLKKATSPSPPPVSPPVAAATSPVVIETAHFAKQVDPHDDECSV